MIDAIEDNKISRLLKTFKEQKQVYLINYSQLLFMFFTNKNKFSNHEQKIEFPSECNNCILLKENISAHSKGKQASCLGDHNCRKLSSLLKILKFIVEGLKDAT